jgi:hypothetical protein
MAGISIFCMNAPVKQSVEPLQAGHLSSFALAAHEGLRARQRLA